MLAPEEQQMAICLLKSNLEEIENDLVVKHLAFPDLEADNEKRYRATMAQLKIVHELHTEEEKIKQENIQLTAKRMQLKQQMDNIRENMKKATENRDKLRESIKQDEQNWENYIRNYEDSMEKIAERFRSTFGYYNGEEINKEIDKLNSVIAELKEVRSKEQSEIDEWSAQVDSVLPAVPEGILEIFNKLESDEKLKLLTNEYEELNKKIN